MVSFRPFRGSHVAADAVRQVPAPAFDSMSTTERTDYLSTHPLSYALVTRSPGDGGPSDSADGESLIRAGADALQRILKTEAFVARDEDAFFLYRLSTGTHSQTGVVGLVDVADYRAGRIKCHEQVSHDRALHLSHHFEQVGAQSSPIAVGYRTDVAVQRHIDRLVKTTIPVLSFTSGDGLEQTVWVIDGPADCAALSAALSAHDVYIMDGHHRAAAAALLAERDPSQSEMLAVAFAQDRLNIEPFHRRVTLDPAVDLHAAHERLARALGLERCVAGTAPIPDQPGAIAVWSQGMWWSGQLPIATSDDPVSAIDAVRLQRCIIGPLFGIDPEHNDGRLQYFQDSANRAELSSTATEREILFVLAPATPEDVFAVADAGQTMPPKSTYVTPKPRSGVFLRNLK